MVRETRHLWVGNLPDNIREDRIREHFKRYGRVQNVKLLGRAESASAGVSATGASGVCAAVAFMDIKSASKAHNAEHVLDERTLTTEYYEPAAIPSTAGAPSAGSSPAGSGYSGSSSSVNSVPAPSSASRYHLSGGEDSSGATTCPIAASAAAPATWRGTNDSATEYCRRGNTPAAYGRTTPHHRWYAGGGGGSGATGGESTPSTPGGCTESGRRRRLSGSASSRSDSSSPEPSDTSRASTPATQPLLSHHSHHRTPPAVSHQWASTSNGRPLSICVRNLPTRSTDSSLKDGLYHEYKKHGKVVWVKVVGQNADRYAIVRFKKPSDVEKALEVSQDKLFFGCKISVAPHQSCDDDADSTKPYETDIDEYHPKATRTLFIGNLEKDVTQQQLRDKFKHFGRIIEIDIKKGSGGGAGYAFCQYASISSVVEAIRAMDGEYVGGSRVKLGFGKPVATACVWVDGLTEHTEKQVLGAVSRCGAATSVCVDRAAGAALVHFEQAAAAGAAVRELRRVAAAASAAEPAHPRLCVDYASRECQEAFYEQLEKHGGSAALAGSERLSGGELSTRYVASTRHDSIRYEGCGSRSRASSYGRSSSRTPRYSALEHYDPVDYAADRRYRVYDETGASSPLEDSPFEDRLQSVVVSPHRARRHCRDSSTEDRKHSKERRRSAGGGGVTRSRSGSVGRERHTARRKHRRRHDGSGSRAGTPLRDEPDAPPAEPRRPPRDRPLLPMCLPLPKFAAQLLRTAPPAPRPTPQPAPAPDSPPRPPSVSSSSGGSAPHSPSLEERIRSLDEKYEKWSGSRAVADAPDRARLRHRLLEVDINEVKPSEVVSALLAKRSVFDEDSERLECVVRAPSPLDGHGRGTAQRVPRFPPLPTQPLPTCAAYVPHHVTLDGDASDRPCDPRLNRPERPCRFEKLGKINESDYGECRLRPRTPSTDRSQPDSCDRRTPPALVDGDAESRSRDSASGTCDAESKSSFDMDDKDIDLGIKRERSNSSTSDSLLTGKSEATVANALLQSTSDVIHENKRLDDSQHYHLDQKCARDVIDMIIKKVESGQKFEPKSEMPCKVPDRESKLEFFKQDEPCSLLGSETKIAICEEMRKSENNTIQIFSQSLSNKDSVEYELHLHHNHSASTINKEKDVINSLNNCSDKNDKDQNISQPYQITKPEKKTIQMEKKLEKEKQRSNSDTPPTVKKFLDTDKNVEDRGVKSDKDKAKNNKERLIKEKQECEKDKLKNNRNEKHIERNEKDRPLKDVYSVERKHIDKSKVEKDIEKKTETDKSKNVEDKSRHDHHKKDKSDKDKRKDSDLGLLNSKSKKDERHKTEKQKKDVDIKRENKKDIECIKTRKLSRDETSKEVSRKDSTDSSTSRASHESTKSKDFDNHDNKEDVKPKVKLTDLFFKLEVDKGSSDSKDVKMEHSVIKIKSEIKEEKFVIGCMLEPHIKPKAEIIEKHRHHSLDSPSVESKRKERLNSCSSLPSNIGHKRRISSHDSFDSVCEEAKKNKNELKLPDRRISKDSRSGDKHKTTKFSKSHFAKILENKTKDEKKDQVKPLDEAALLEFKENNDTKNSSIKGPKRPSKEDNNEDITENNEDAHNNLDFLALFELRSSEEDERQKALRKEMKEKKRIQQLQQIQELQMQQDAMQQGELLGKLKDDKKQKSEDKKKDAVREKRFSIDRKSREEKMDSNKKKNRKLVQSSDTSDSDEPKKHSIFDIIDDGPTYISMYDKVKARSCKNMQKQEEEKRQEKIKAKFSQLKQSRAKREEKKRSSWDEDSDSEHDVRKTQKSSLENSSDEEDIHDKKHDKSHMDFDEDNRTEEYFSMPKDDEFRNKLARKNSRSRIISDSSGDDTSKSKSPNYHNEDKKCNISGLDSLATGNIEGAKDLDDQIKKSSLLHLFGKSDSDDSKLKSNIDDDRTYKLPNFKPMCNDLSSESESVTSNRNSGEFRRKHKKKPKKYKSTYSDEENKINHIDSGVADGENRHKISEKQRRHSSKKDKRREKNRESIDTDEGGRDDKLKLRREKRSPDNAIVFEYGTDVVSNTTKRDGKMEDIFGPLSDESDKDTEPQSKSEFACHDFDFMKDRFNSTEMKLTEKDDLKRKKEKKRKEKRWLREDDNSLDMDAVSKAIEARLFAESITDDEARIKMEAPQENMKIENNDDGKYMDSKSFNDVFKLNNKHDKLRRDSRDKKKKKKRNKEERQNRKEQNPFYQNTESLEKSDTEMTERPTLETMTNTMLLDIPLPNDSQAVGEKTDEGKSLEESQSLPRLTESPPILIQSIHDIETKSVASSTSSNILSDNDNNIYLESKSIEIEQIPMPPPPFENIVQDISEVPLPTDPEPTGLNAIKSNNFVATLSSDSDLSEDAVQSLSVRETDNDKTVKIDTTQEKHADRTDATPSKVEKKAEEKPRAVISQEETEDAVAALLGESFGGKINIFSSYEDAENNAAHQNESESTLLSTANIPEEDAEEMRQAVQNLNACEMEMKPDTPVSDNDLLLIDTDNEETDESLQDSSEKTPISIVVPHVPLINNLEKTKPAEELPIQVSISKPSIESKTTKAQLVEVNKNNDKDIKIQLPRRENVHIITSTATPVITSWTLTNNKILEPHVINIQPNMPSTKDKTEGKTTNITTNIVQIKTTQNQNLQINNIVKPVTPTRVSAPYQVIGQMFRPQVTNMQPPTIKIPEPHILYQKQQGIVISPRMANDPRMQSPKTSPQGDGMTSPRLPTIPVLSSSPQNMNPSGLVSPNSIHQRSPGQVTVVRVQQPPLSPIQAMHLTPGARTMVSPSRPNSVLVQTQRSPHHHSRLPVTPLLTPIPKQINIGTVLHQPNKGIAGNNPPILNQQKIITGDVRINEIRNISESKDNNKIILPASTSLQHSTNPTVMAQNRLISMQNVGNLNSHLHLNNKFVINKMSSLNEKRENTHPKVADHGSRQGPFVSSPIIHVGGVNHSTPSIIQSGTKQVMCNLQEASNISRGQASNVIHTLNSQRLLTPASISNLRHLEMNKVSPSVLAMATIRPSTVLTMLESSNISTVTTSNVTNVKTPILIKSGATIGTVRLGSKPEIDNVVINTSVPQKEKVDNKIEKEVSLAADGNNLIKQAAFTLNTLENSSKEIEKCETDFEELLKDNTNKIIITKDSDTKIEGNVEKTTTVISKQSHDKPHIPNNENRFQLKEQEVPTTDQVSLEFSSFERKNDKPNELDDLNKTSNLKETSNETLSKENTSSLLNVKPTHKDNNIVNENLQLHKDKSFSPMLGILLDKAYENVSTEKDLKTPLDFIKNEKTDDFAKESSNLSEIIENQLKTLDENDSWSAKDLNIESVIKKVDSLCNESIESFQTSHETRESENPEKVKPTQELVTDSTILEEHSDHVNTDNTEVSSENIANNANLNTFVNVSTSKRGGRSIRGKKSEKTQDRVQTRQITKTPRGGVTSKRGRGRAKVDKKGRNMVTCNTSTIPGDIYDFHEDSGDEGSNKAEPRPRLILTIKSPISGQVGVTATSTLSIAQKEQNKFEERRLSRDDKMEDFVSPSPNTRKSRRLQEKDVHRSVADEIGEDGARNSRSAKRRPIRQTVAGKPTNYEKIDKALSADTRKSPRGTKRTRDRSLSDASIDSGDGDGRRDDVTRDPKAPRLEESVVPPADPEPSLAPRSASSISAAPSLTSNVILSNVPPTIPTPAALHPISSIVPEPAPPVDSLVAVSIAPKLVVPTSSAVVVSTSPTIAVSTSPIIAVSVSLTIAVSTSPSPTIAVAVPPSVAASSSSLLAPSVVPSIVPTDIPTVTPVVPSLAAPPPAPTPITKPPKKMISEISAKLAGAFEASGQHRPVAEPPAGAPGEAQLGEARRPGDSVPCAMLPVGATEAADARVQSPALPHRPPAAQRVVVDRATPILIRGGEGEAGAMGALGAMGAAGAGGARYRALVAGSGGPASLPRGAHHPPPDPPPLAAAHHPPPAPLHHRAHPGAASRITSVPSISPQGQMALGEGMYPHFSQQHFQMYQQHFRATQHERATPSPYTRIEAEGTEAPTSPLELRRISARVPRPAHSPSPADRHIMYAVVCGRSPPPAHGGLARAAGALPPGGAPGPPHASQVPHEADSLQMLLRRYPVMWQGLLALKNDSAAVQMHFVGGNPGVASETLARPPDLVTPMLRIAQRMRLEPMQLDQVHRKMKLENEHCILLALPCGRDHMDVLQQSTNLSAGFITYLQRKTAAGIVNIAPPGHQQAMFTVHVFPSCDFANENLSRIAPDLMHRVANIAHLLIVIATV